MSEEEQIAMAMQMSLQSDVESAAAADSPVRNPPGAPKKPKREDNDDNKNNSSEDRKRPRESEGSAGGSNPPTPGRKGGRCRVLLSMIIAWYIS